MKTPITIWRYQDAPKYLQKLSTHGGDEDWLAIIPRHLCNDAPRNWPDPNNDRDQDAYLPYWMQTGTPFGCCQVSVYSHPLVPKTAVVAIGAHA